MPQLSHSQAAPRTPEESPWRFLTSRVATWSEKTCARPQARHVVVEPVEVGQAAAEHDDVRVEDVDHLRQRSRQPLLVARAASPRTRHRRCGARDDLGRVEDCRRRLRGRAPGRAGEQRLDAAAPAAIALGGWRARRAADCGPTRRRWRWRRRAPGHRTTMPPPTPVPRMTPNTTSAPAAAPSVASESAKQLASLAMRTSRRSSACEVAPQRPADQPGRVGVLDQAGDPRLGAGNADADRAALAEFALGRLDQAGDGIDAWPR